MLFALSPILFSAAIVQSVFGAFQNDTAHKRSYFFTS